MALRNRWQGAALMAVVAATGTASAADVAPSMLVIERYAAERGDANAQYFMGEHHELGDSGVPKNPGKALDLYSKAAEQEHGPAQYKLGLFHEKGLAGLQPDHNQALQWYRRAARNGSTLASQRLAEIDREAEASARQRRDQALKAARERQRTEREAQQRKAEAEKRRQQNHAAKPPAPAPTPVTAAKKARPGLDADRLFEHVANASWYESGRAAEFLPTEDMSCLRTSQGEITCFSKERRRTVATRPATFSVKTVLDGFSDGGEFKVSYTYNVTDLGPAKAKTSPDDEYGLLPQTGWQQPARSARCRLKAPGLLQCRGAQDKTREFRTR
jgi:hypothetical protein